MRTLLAALLVTWSVGCGPTVRGDGGDAGDSSSPDACAGLECRVVDCAADGRPPTTISGTVFAPNGTLPLFGVNVYIPNADPGPFTDGVQCSQCDDALPGNPIRTDVSDEAGRFQLDNVPAGINVPIVVTVGKWRRQVFVPQVAECTDNPLPATMTSLPKTRLEGDIPKIAIGTGQCDALECLIRKIGIADSEFGAPGSPARVHMYASDGANKFTDGTLFGSAQTLWGSVANLAQYDIALFSCECSPQPEEKPQSAMDAMKAYADMGGRIFLSHYHNIWIDGERGNPSHAPAVWPTIAECPSDQIFGDITGVIDTVGNPKGTSFQTWMQNVMGTTTPGIIPISEGRQTCTSVDPTKGERWVGYESATGAPQTFQFTTPNEAVQEQRCGRVVFSDMHVASGSSSSASTPFPNGCAATPLTPQEKALAFMFFDISSCVGTLF